MLVPDEVRKCVVFICYRDKDNIKLAGTAFFISIPSVIEGKSYPYLVTAKHVIEAIKKHSIDNKVYFRINQTGNSTALIHSDLSQWKYHPSEQNVDVAAANLAPDTSLYDFRTIPSSMAITPEIIISKGVGCGDEVFLTGLFSNHYGQ